MDRLPDARGGGPIVTNRTEPMAIWPPAPRNRSLVLPVSHERQNISGAGQRRPQRVESVEAETRRIMDSIHEYRRQLPLWPF